MNPLDAISLEILWSRLLNIAEEGWLAIWKTSFSMIVGDAQDHGFEVFDARGRALAHAPRSMPLFNYTLERTVQHMMERFPQDVLRPGDMLLTNDPWIASGHTADVTLVSPVFDAGRIVAFVAGVAHCTDIGGSRDVSGARDVFEEGLQIPPVKLFREGRADESLMEMILQNVRAPAMVRGDLEALATANRLGAARLADLLKEYSLRDLEEVSHSIRGRSRLMMERAIAAVPDGEYRSEIAIELPSGSTSLPCCVAVSGSAMTIDWEGAPPQEAIGGVNCTFAYTAGHSLYAARCVLTPGQPGNAGVYEPIRVAAPSSSLLNCDFPASVRARIAVGWYCAPAIFAALAPIVPKRVQAASGLPAAVHIFGQGQHGTFADLLFQGGGQGAASGRDGTDALIFPSSAGNTSVELFESRVPLLVEFKEYIPDSGGPGEYRGGVGQRVRLRGVSSNPDAVLASVRIHGIEIAPIGLFGGLNGRRSSVHFKLESAEDDDQAPHRLAEIGSDADRLTIELAGGAGYGQPERRAISRIQRDFDDGLVTHEGLRAYGCSLSPNGEVKRIPG